MKKLRLPALLLALCLAFGLAGIPAAAAADPEPDCDEVFVVVHTNDVHGYIDVEPYVKAVADDMKAQYGEKNVITVSAGDVFAGGNAVADLFNGETIPPIMDAAGYDMMVVGNNDLRLLTTQPNDVTEMFEHTKALCANLFEQVLDDSGAIASDEAGAPLAGDSVYERTMTLETEGGVKVGVFGLTVTGDPVDDYFTCMGSIQGAQEAVDILQGEGCTVIVGVGHTGWNDDLVTPIVNDVTSAAVAKAVPGIDAYVDGHSHSIINNGDGWICPETGTLVNQASCKGECVGVMKLYIKDGAVVDRTARIITEEELMAEYEPDPEVKAVCDAAWERLAEKQGELYIDTEYFLNGQRSSENEDGRSIRTDETNLGDLVADFIRWYTGADVAVAAGFTIRSSIQPGGIYTVDLYSLYANGCQLFQYELTGAELLQKLAASLSSLPVEMPTFNQISGASYGYIIEQGGGSGEASGSASGGASGGKTYIIIDPMVGGEPLDLEKTYVIASNNNSDTSLDPEPLFLTMEEAAQAMGEYLKSGEAVILPDVPTPDSRIVPMDEIPEGAVTYVVS